MPNNSVAADKMSGEFWDISETSFMSFMRAGLGNCDLTFTCDSYKKGKEDKGTVTNTMVTQRR